MQIQIQESHTNADPYPLHCFSNSGITLNFPLSVLCFDLKVVWEKRIEILMLFRVNNLGSGAWSGSAKSVPDGTVPRMKSQKPKHYLGRYLQYFNTVGNIHELAIFWSLRPDFTVGAFKSENFVINLCCLVGPHFCLKWSFTYYSFASGVYLYFVPERFCSVRYRTSLYKRLWNSIKIRLLPYLPNDHFENETNNDWFDIIISCGGSRDKFNLTN